MRSVLNSREFDKFVPSRLRPIGDSSAVEVIIGNAEDISSGEGSSGSLLTSYQESLAVISGVTSTVLTHTFSSSKESKVKNISVSGENIATYELFIDSQLIEKKRTYFGASLNSDFDFTQGLKVPLGSTLEVKVHHQRPMPGDFNATLKYTEAL